MATNNTEPLREGDRLYTTYGKPLAHDHWGAYVAISTSGEYILGDSVLDVLERAEDAFAGNSYIFKIGDVSVGKI